MSTLRPSNRGAHRLTDPGAPTRMRPTFKGRDEHGLTTRQREVFEFLYGFARDHGYQPNVVEISTAIGCSYSHGCLNHLVALRRKGWIRLDKNIARAITFLKRPDGSEFTGFADKTSGD